MVDVTADGEAAVARFVDSIHSAPYDAVILDLMVPGGMGGADTLTELRKIAPDVKAVLSSGSSTNPIIMNYADYGFKGALIKPFTGEELGQLLEDILRG